MRKSLISVLAMLAIPGLGFMTAFAQGEKNTINPSLIRGKVNPQIAASMRGRLPNAESKKRFVARQLKLNPAVLGISQPVLLKINRAQLSLPGKVNIKVDGRVSIDPRRNQFRIRTNGSVYVHFRPNALQRKNLYLVSATIDPVRAGKMSSRHHEGSRFKTDLISIDASPRTLNFIVEPHGTQDAFLQLFADTTWDFAQVEITPISR